MWFLILRIEFYNTRMIGGFTMKHKLKDPGSAITHLIGMILAAIVSIPLIIKSFLSGDYVHAIHDRHHQVANNKIHVLGLEHSQCFFTLGCFKYVIIFGQNGTDKIGRAHV